MRKPSKNNKHGEERIRLLYYLHEALVDNEIKTENIYKKGVMEEQLSIFLKGC